MTMEWWQVALTVVMYFGVGAVFGGDLGARCERRGCWKHGRTYCNEHRPTDKGAPGPYSGT